MSRHQRRLRRRRPGGRRFFFGLSATTTLVLLLILGVAIFAFATTIAGVSPPRLGSSQYSVGPNDVKPSQCGAITLTNLVTGNTGTAGNDLMYSNGGLFANVQGGDGNDCIVLSATAMMLNGGNGTDVCIGTSHVWWTVTNCETQYP